MISAAFLVMGLGIGFAGSLHCVGMCGPLALSLPLQSFSNSKRIVALLLYNLGRVLSYMLLGAATGLIGRQFFLAGYQQLFSLLAGALLVVWLLLSIAGKTRGSRSVVYYKIQGWIVRYMQEPSLKHMLFTGIGNGLLPCGMVYLGIATAAASGSMISAISFMFFFGLGTIPLMAMVSVAGLRIRPSLRITLKKVSPYLTAFIGVLLILRGLNLNIPYLSPLLSAGTKEAISCHPF
jgi:sulfite exporter TauE/SafE